jgi:hypothetical protein
MIPLMLSATALEAAMMGRQIGDQASLFYEFRLEDRIPKDHLLRRINVFMTPVLSDMREQLKPYYSEIGRPSIDPELMIRMLIVGYATACAQRSWPRKPGASGIPLVAGSISMTRFRTTRPSRRTGCIVSGRVMSFATSSSVSLRPAWRPAWSRARGLPSMPA